MKSYLNIFILILVFIQFSCKKQLNEGPISNVTSDNFYQSANDFNVALNGLYTKALKTYPDRQLNLSETRSDNLYAITDGTRGWEGINNFTTDLASNTYIQAAYNDNYAALSNINLFIEKMTSVGSNYITDNVTFNTMIGQAYFLRAFCYFDLVRWFGKVPLIDKTTTAEEALTIPRTSVSEIYDLIESDLNSAIDNLPASYSSTDIGRVTSLAAKSYLALVYMTKSSPTYDIEGPGLNSNEWQKASDLLGDVLNNTVGKSFISSPYSSIYSYDNENSQEDIFDVQYQSGGQGLGATYVVLLTPEQYFYSFGLPVQGSVYQRPVSNDFLSKFSVTDNRRIFSIVDSFYYQNQLLDYAFYKKYVNAAKYGTSRTDWSLNYIAMSYTNVMLLKAECNLQLGNTADAITIVNKVRTRAGISSVTSLTLAELFEERRREFCGEGWRWHDLVRTGDIVNIMNNWIAADDVSGMMNTFTKNFIIYPFPQSEINKAPDVYTQNPGYD